MLLFWGGKVLDKILTWFCIAICVSFELSGVTGGVFGCEMRYVI